MKCCTFGQIYTFPTRSSLQFIVNLLRSALSQNTMRTSNFTALQKWIGSSLNYQRSWVFFQIDNHVKRNSRSPHQIEKNQNKNLKLKIIKLTKKKNIKSRIRRKVNKNSKKMTRYSRIKWYQWWLIVVNLRLLVSLKKRRFLPMLSIEKTQLKIHRIWRRKLITQKSKWRKKLSLTLQWVRFKKFQGKMDPLDWTPYLSRRVAKFFQLFLPASKSPGRLPNNSQNNHQYSLQKPIAKMWPQFLQKGLIIKQ